MPKKCFPQKQSPEVAQPPELIQLEIKLRDFCLEEINRRVEGIILSHTKKIALLHKMQQTVMNLRIEMESEEKSLQEMFESFFAEVSRLLTDLLELELGNSRK